MGHCSMNQYRIIDQYKNNQFYNIFYSVSVPIILIKDITETSEVDEILYINRAAISFIRNCFGAPCKNCKEHCINLLKEILNEGIRELIHSRSLDYKYTSSYTRENRTKYLEVHLTKTTDFNLQEDSYDPLIIITIKDITEEYFAEQYIIRSNNITRTINKITSNFIGIFDMDEAINNTLMEIGRIIDADHVYIFRFQEKNAYMKLTHEWYNGAIKSLKNQLDDLLTAEYPWWMRQLSTNKVIEITNTLQISEEAVNESKVLQELNIESLIAYPLQIKGELIGFLGVANKNRIIKRKKDVQLLLEIVVNNLNSVFEKEAADLKLMESEKKFRELFNSIDAGIFLHKIDSDYSQDFMMVNDYACKLLEYPCEELLTKGPSEILSEVGKKQLKYIMHDIIKHGKLTFEIDFKTRHNDIIPVEIMTRVCSINGEEVLISVVKDIRERKKSENEIKKLYRAIEQSPSSIIITDNMGKIEYVNHKFIETTGYGLNEVLGKNPNIIQSGTQPKGFYNELWNTIESGKVWSGEFHNRRKNNSTYWAQALISPVKNEKGVITHYIGIQEDVTEKKIMEENLRRTNIELQGTVKELRLIQQQLIQQEKMAAIGQLAAGVAHEINNPLGYIHSNYYSLKQYIDAFKELIDTYQETLKFSEEMDSVELRNLLVERAKILENKKNIKFMIEDIPDLLSDTFEGLERIESIVKGLRVFSRIDSSDSFEEYDLNEGISCTLLIINNEIKYTAEVKKVFGELPLIDAISNQVNQVILNLLANGIHAIKSKNSNDEGLIVIKTYVQGDFVICEIEDNGIGIPEANLNQIFNPFFTTKPVGEGTGLGLSISYDIIKSKHNGDIEVESMVNVGTKFILKLPIKQQKVEQIA